MRKTRIYYYWGDAEEQMLIMKEYHMYLFMLFRVCMENALSVS